MGHENLGGELTCRGVQSALSLAPSDDGDLDQLQVDRPVYGGGLGGVADRVADGQGTDSAALDVSGRGLAVLGTEVESALDGHARSGRKAIA